MQPCLGFLGSDIGKVAFFLGMWMQNAPEAPGRLQQLQESLQQLQAMSEAGGLQPQAQKTGKCTSE